MKVAAITALVSSAVAASALPLLNGQTTLGGHDSLMAGLLAPYEGITVPGFDLDLNALRLVQFGDFDEPQWITERQKIIEKARGRNFFDVTETRSLGQANLAPVTYKYPQPNSTHVGPLLKKLTESGIKTNLEKFSSFRTRYYRSQTGKESSEWLLARIQAYIAAASPAVQKRVSVLPFPHTWAQSSVIVSFAPADKADADKPITILGAHQDSTNLIPFLPAPGADDDGSGTCSTLEALRVLLEAEWAPVTPVEFHYYSAEEGGLLGSQAVAQAYEKAGKKVYAMSQTDMTAFVKPGSIEAVGIIEDFVDPALTEFNKALVERYLDIPWAPTTCGYACSDHASFSKAGYQASFTIESLFPDSNQAIHSTRDVIDTPGFSFSHAKEFSKLAVAFAIELGGWAGK